MAVKRVLPQETRVVEAVVDTGPVALAHFENPAQKSAIAFLSDALSLKKIAVIPTSTILGAYHIMTEYIGVERVSAYKSLSKTLQTSSPNLYEDVTIDATLDAITYATTYNIESWDGYLVSIAKVLNAPIIYSIDRELAKKVRDPRVLNPIPEEDFSKYNTWLRKKIRGHT